MAWHLGAKNRRCLGVWIKKCAPPTYPKEPLGTRAIRRQFGRSGRLFSAEYANFEVICQLGVDRLVPQTDFHPCWLRHRRACRQPCQRRPQHKQRHVYRQNSGPFPPKSAPGTIASLTRLIAGCVRFFTLSQCFDGPPDTVDPGASIPGPLIPFCKPPETGPGRSRLVRMGR